MKKLSSLRIAAGVAAYQRAPAASRDTEHETTILPWREFFLGTKLRDVSALCRFCLSKVGPAAFPRRVGGLFRPVDAEGRPVSCVCSPCVSACLSRFLELPRSPQRELW